MQLAGEALHRKLVDVNQVRLRLKNEIKSEVKKF